jgi:putative protease
MASSTQNTFPVIFGNIDLHSQHGLYLIQVVKPVGGDEMPEKEIGKISDFFSRPVVAGIELTAPLNIGDKIHIKGHTTDLEMAVASMQINNVDVKAAKAGDSVGVKVTDRVRRGDTVYQVT